MEKTFKRLMISFIIINLIVGGAFHTHTAPDDGEKDTFESISQQADASRTPLEIAGTGGIVISTTPTETEAITETTEPTESTTEPTEAPETLEPQEIEVVVEEKPKYATLSEITSESSTEDCIRAIMQYLIDNGYTTEAAAAVVGNIAVESAFHPETVGYQGDYYGLCQWNTTYGGGYWWDTIRSWLSDNGFGEYSFEGQVRAIIECPEKKCFAEWCQEEMTSLTNIDQATELFTVYYECCIGGEDRTQYYAKGTCYQDLNLRKSEAKIAYEVFTNPDAVYTGQKPR